MARVSINTDSVSEIVGYLNESCSILEGDVLTNLSEAFQILMDLGLVSNCISKLQAQVNSIINSEKSIVASISSHLSEVNNNEQRLYNNFIGGSSSGGGYSGGSGSSSVSEGSNYNIDEKQDGKAVKAEELDQIINVLSENTKEVLLNLININKGNNTSLNDLILNDNYSEELFVLLKNIFANNYILEDYTLDDMKNIQKSILRLIANSETEYIEYESNSILIGKEYLISVCKENNIGIDDLIFDDEYRELLKTSLKNIYDDKTNGILSQEKTTKFKEYVDKVATEKQTTAIELIDNNVDVLL